MDRSYARLAGSRPKWRRRDCGARSGGGQGDAGRVFEIDHRLAIGLDPRPVSSPRSRPVHGRCRAPASRSATAIDRRPLRSDRYRRELPGWSSRITRAKVVPSPNRRAPRRSSGPSLRRVESGPKPARVDKASDRGSNRAAACLRPTFEGGSKPFSKSGGRALPSRGARL